MAALDRRMIYHFDWGVFVLALALAGVGVTSVLSATWGNPRHGLDPLVVRYTQYFAKTGGGGSAEIATAG